MNIQKHYRNLKSYSIEDYFNIDNSDNFKPYLWTSAYALLVLISNKSPRKNIKKYIRVVHQRLGTFNNEILSKKIKLDWLNSSNKELIQKSIKGLIPIHGGLRIGKDEQGQEEGIYLHYITKWVYSLIIASNYLKDNRYFYLAIQLMLTMCEKNIDYRNNGSIYYPRKMNVFLNKPLEKSEISHDSLDVFITLMTLLINISSKKDSIYKTIYIELLINAINNNINDLNKYLISNNLYTSDQLGIGFLLVSCLKIRIIIYYKKLYKNYININNEKIDTIYFNLLNNSLIALRKLKFNNEIINNDGYRWFGICIGLDAIYYLNYYYKNIFNDKYNILIKQILEFYYLKNKIINNFNTISYNKSNFNLHKDINIIMYLNTFNPILTI